MESNVHRSTSYRSTYASLVSSEHSGLERIGHGFSGDVYITGNATAHFGDAISSRSDLVGSQLSIRPDDERQRRTDLFSKSLMHYPLTQLTLCSRGEECSALRRA